MRDREHSPGSPIKSMGAAISQSSSQEDAASYVSHPNSLGALRSKKSEALGKPYSDENYLKYEASL